MAKSSDDLVVELMGKVKAKQAEINALERPTWVTSCTIGFSDSVHDRINFMTIKAPEKLVEIYTKLLNLESQWERANKELGLQAPCMHQGYKITDWKIDLKMRAAQLMIEKKRAELASLSARLDPLMTPERRRELELAAIKAELDQS